VFLCFSDLVEKTITRKVVLATNSSQTTDSQSTKTTEPPTNNNEKDTQMKRLLEQTKSDGDMILTDEQIENVLEPVENQKTGEDRRKRKRRGLGRGVTGFHIWEYGIVPFSFSNAFGPKQRHIIRSSLAQLGFMTCINFQDVTDHETKPEYYIDIVSLVPGCFSFVGRIRTSRQILNLYIPPLKNDDDKNENTTDDKTNSGDDSDKVTKDYMNKTKAIIENRTENIDAHAQKLRHEDDDELEKNPDYCVKRHIVQHEFIHVLGFMHEMQRDDRDDYVRINWENIQDSPRAALNFRKAFKTFNLGTKFDPDSIMHYTNFQLSKNGKATIEWKADPSRPLGGYTPSPTDVYQIRKVYEKECKKRLKAASPLQSFPMPHLNPYKKPKCRDLKKICRIMSVHRPHYCEIPQFSLNCPKSCGKCKCSDEFKNSKK